MCFNNSGTHSLFFYQETLVYTNSFFVVLRFYIWLINISINSYLWWFIMQYKVNIQNSKYYFCKYKIERKKNL